MSRVLNRHYQKIRNTFQKKRQHQKTNSKEKKMFELCKLKKKPRFLLKKKATLLFGMLFLASYGIVKLFKV